MDEQDPDIEDGPQEPTALTAETLARHYGRAVLSVCLARVGNHHDAEDLMQEVFAKAIRKLPDLRESRSAGPWLLAIARTTCIDHLRRRKPAVAPLSDDLPAAEDKHAETTEHLQAALGRLPEDYAEVLNLYYLDGRRSAHVAEVLGLTPEAVRTRLVRARAMLHDLLAEERS